MKIPRYYQSTAQNAALVMVSILLSLSSTPIYSQAKSIDLSTPITASHEHMVALMSLDNQNIARTVSFPLLHIDVSGSKAVVNSLEDLPDMSDIPYRTLMTNVELLDLGVDVAVVKTYFQRHDLEGNPTVKGSAYWGLRKHESEWLVSWRQFLGTYE